MPIRIKGNRESNVIDIPASLMDTLNVVILLTGDGATVSIGEGCQVLQGVHITAGGGCEIMIGRRCIIGQLALFSAGEAPIRIGEGVGFNGSVRLMSHETAAITIGSQSLIAGGVDVMASDIHSIIDVQSGQRINPCEEIVVGENVWIAKGVSVMKGARIGANSVIGAHSVVSGEIPANCVAAGVPARVLRTGVTWSRKLLPMGCVVV